MKKRIFSHVMEIMKTDTKAIFTNPAVLLILIGIIFLPSLYALLNVQACWDPYGSTGEIEFAIANLDNGTSINGTKLNIGNELVKELKNNTKFKWTFVSEDELREGVYKGDYYAGIIIPQNLSDNIISIASDNPKQAKLQYVVNVKSNPVAVKLTDTGSNLVYMSLNAKIVEIINLAAYGKLGELQEGLASGASQLADGGSQLSAGAGEVSSGVGQLKGGVGEVTNGASQLKGGVSQVQKGASDLNGGVKEVQKGSKALKNGANEVQKGSQEIQSVIDPSLIPEGPVKEYVEGNVKLAQGSGTVADGASQLADGSVELAQGSMTLAAGAELLSTSAAQALFTAASSLGASADALSALTGINETILGDYFYSPVKLDRNEVFPVPNYGSQVVPFYFVLSMWVGALITCAMVKPGISQGTKYTPLEVYFGRLSLFLLISIFQSIVTLTGAFMMGIYIANPILFILSTFLVALVFMALMYSFVSAVGEVGKAIAIVLLVIQLSGTGGMYPVEIMDHFFIVMNPYLPMTYAITLIRESQLGLVWSNYLFALIILLAIGIVTVVVSIIIKHKADKAAHFFERRLEDSGLF